MYVYMYVGMKAMMCVACKINNSAEDSGVMQPVRKFRGCCSECFIRAHAFLH